MPEGPEIRIMSHFINEKSVDRIYKDLFFVEKGNIPTVCEEINNFRLTSSSSGKSLKLCLIGETTSKLSVFMGMSGNWKFVRTENWDLTKFVRMRIDSNDGMSLLLYGGYLGPKYKIGDFSGVKRGPDIIDEFHLFKMNILSNLYRSHFDGHICDVILDQRYFNGIGNYLRSTILYYMDKNPFMCSRDYINRYPNFFDMCRDTQIKSYDLNGGQIKDWDNPFNVDRNDFKNWVFYQKGSSCKDSSGRTFWFDDKWDSPYKK